MEDKVRLPQMKLSLPTAEGKVVLAPVGGKVTITIRRSRCSDVIVNVDATHFLQAAAAIRATRDRP